MALRFRNSTLTTFSSRWFAFSRGPVRTVLLYAICLGAMGCSWKVALSQDQTPQDQAPQNQTREWHYETTIDLFEIHADFPVPDPKQLESTLLHLRNDIEELLGLPARESTVHVVLFGNSEEYARYMKHYFPSIFERRAIFLKDRGPGMLFTFWHTDIETDLRHEATHALLHQSGVHWPLWLDEGLAEYFEVDRDARYAACPYLTEVVQRAETGLVPSLKELEEIVELAGFAESHYRDSWAWVHLLLHRRPETRQLLTDYLARAYRRTPQPPLHRQLAKIMDDPASEFREHFKLLAASR